MAGLVGLALLSGLACNGCGLFGVSQPRAQRALSTFQCRVSALSPYLGAVYDVEDLTRDVIAGKVDPIGVAMALGATEADILALIAAWRSCDAPPALPAKTVEI